MATRKGGQPERLQRRGTFRVVPDALVFDWRLSARAKELWLVLHSFANEEDQAWPGIAGVANRAEVRASHLGPNLPSERTLKRAMAELVAAGWVHRKRRPGTSSVTFICQTAGESAPWDEAQTLPLGPDMAQPNGPNVARNTGPDMAQPNGPNVARKREPVDREPETENQSAAKAEILKRLTDHVYEHRPYNSAKWVAIRAVAAKLLAAGHDPKAVARAMIEAPTVSVGAVEVTLAKSRKRTDAVARARSSINQKAGEIND